MEETKKAGSANSALGFLGKQFTQTSENRKHINRLRKAKHLHRDELRFLMEHGAEFPLTKKQANYITRYKELV